MKRSLKKEIERIIKEEDLDCTVEKFQDKVDWGWISRYQNLSEDFIEKFQDKVNISVYRAVHQEKTKKQKLEEMKAYAKEYNLKFDGKYLYAFRNHDKWGRGSFCKALRYDSGYYYRDWHLDMRKGVEDSFGMGIWPEGNTPIRVKVEDWGIAVNREDGKARVWGFEVL